MKILYCPRNTYNRLSNAWENREEIYGALKDDISYHWNLNDYGKGQVFGKFHTLLFDALVGGKGSKYAFNTINKFSDLSSVTRSVSSAASKVDVGPDIKFRSFTKRNFRENMGRLTGTKPEGAHAHHMFPNKYELKFNRAGIDSHNPKYGAWWKASPHLRDSYAFNKSWGQFFARGAYSPENVLNFGRRLASKYDLTIGF